MGFLVNRNVKKMAKVFGSETPLFIVGGFVRNKLMRVHGSDIDLTSSLTPKQVMQKLKGSKFQAKIKNNKLGALEISYKNYKFDYTTFRLESYNIKGKHTPNEVVFTTSIIDDSKRRDFSINCIYYNILNRQIVDFYGGVKDIQNKTVRAIENPQNTLSDDGERILRMIRFCAELGFCVDEETYSAAQQNCSNVAKLSKERMAKEFFKILKASFYKRNNKLGGHSGIRLIDKLNIWTSLFDRSDELKFLNGVSSYMPNFVGANKNNYMFAFCYDLYKYFKEVFKLDISERDFIEKLFGENAFEIKKCYRSQLAKALSTKLQNKEQINVIIKKFCFREKGEK